MCARVCICFFVWLETVKGTCGSVGLKSGFHDDLRFGFTTNGLLGLRDNFRKENRRDLQVGFAFRILLSKSVLRPRIYKLLNKVCRAIVIDFKQWLSAVWTHSVLFFFMIMLF